jgi:Phage terminase-like protein, large subunit
LTISPPPVLLGAQRPRYRTVPRARTSAGQEAAELAASAGLHLDQWQRDALVDMLGERADGKWAAFEAALIVPRQNGKGAVLEALELAGLFLFGERLILHSAHEFKTAQEGFQRALALITNADHLRKLVSRVRTSHGEEGIELRSGARLRFVARSTGSGRGFSADRVILDEAYNLPSEVMAALLPTLSARPNPQLVYASSAPLLTSEVLRKLCVRGRSGKSRRLAYLEWCADRGDDEGDRRAWAAANPAFGIRIDEEFVESEREALGAEFGRERLGVWHEEGLPTVVDMRLWAQLADVESLTGDPVAFGVDIRPDHGAGAIAVCGAREDGLVHLEVVDHRPGTGWIVERLVELVERWRPCAVVLDGAGAAGGLIPDLRTAGVEPHVTGVREAGQACGRIKAEIVARGVRHIDQVELNAALSGAQTRPLGELWAWSRRDSTVDISPLVAVTLARHGFALFGHGGDPLDNIW